MEKLEKQMILKPVKENGSAVRGMIMKKNLSSGVKTINFCGTPPSNTN